MLRQAQHEGVAEQAGYSSPAGLGQETYKEICMSLSKEFTPRNFAEILPAYFGASIVFFRPVCAVDRAIRWQVPGAHALCDPSLRKCAYSTVYLFKINWL